MINQITIAQLIVAISVIYVWTFRYKNVVKEFVKFNLSGLVRNLTGTTKTILATLLIAGIWYPALTYPVAIGMAIMMIMAQIFHQKVSSTIIKRIPSFILLLLSIYIITFS